MVKNSYIKLTFMLSLFVFTTFASKSWERPSTINEQEGEEEEPEEVGEDEIKELAKKILASPKIKALNKLYQMRCNYGQQYAQGREGGKYSGIELWEMRPSSLIRSPRYR